MRVLFVGDIVGEAGVGYLADRLPQLREENAVDAVVANGENMAVSGPDPHHGFGMLMSQVKRLFDAGVDVITSGNHSWDAPEAAKVLAEDRVLRPANVPKQWSGSGSTTLQVGGEPLTVINLAGRSAIPEASSPYDAFKEISIPTGACIVDFHGDIVGEKFSFAFAVDGHVSAVLGTHTHEPTLLMHTLPQGTAFVAEVGMTGPLGGMLGSSPERFVYDIKGLDANSLPGFTVPDGPVTLGAVVCDIEPGRPTRVRRIGVDDTQVA